MMLPPRALLALQALAVLLIARATFAFPTGEGGCLGGPELSNLVAGSLADGNIELELDGDPLTEERPLFIRVDKVTPMVMKAAYSGNGIKGFLIRLSSSDGAIEYDLSNALTPPPAATEDERQYIGTQLAESLSLIHI